MKYKKKPVVIEAQRLTEQNGQSIATWCGGTWHPTEKPGYACKLNVTTLEGVMQTNVGDYIIKGIKGEFYPCKPDIFEATYEPQPHRVMVCGVDCHPGDSVCNNYCNSAPQKGPMASEPPPGPDADYHN